MLILATTKAFAVLQLLSTPVAPIDLDGVREQSNEVQLAQPCTAPEWYLNIPEDGIFLYIPKSGFAATLDSAEKEATKEVSRALIRTLSEKVIQSLQHTDSAGISRTVIKEEIWARGITAGIISHKNHPCARPNGYQTFSLQRIPWSFVYDRLKLNIPESMNFSYEEFLRRFVSRGVLDQSRLSMVGKSIVSPGWASYRAGNPTKGRVSRYGTVIGVAGGVLAYAIGRSEYATSRKSSDYLNARNHSRRGSDLYAVSTGAFLVGGVSLSLGIFDAITLDRTPKRY